MNDEHDEKLKELGERIARGEYEIDPRAVADAMLRRPGLAQIIGAAPFQVVVRAPDELRELARRDEAEAAQDKCSYPASSTPPESVNVSLGGPESTCPTHVIITGSRSEASAASIIDTSSAAAQTQSS